MMSVIRAYQGPKMRSSACALVTVLLLFLSALAPPVHADTNPACQRFFAGIAIDEEIGKADNRLEGLDSCLRGTNSQLFQFAVLERTEKGVVASYKDAGGTYKRKVLSSEQEIAPLLKEMSGDTNAFACKGDVNTQSIPQSFTIFRTYNDHWSSLVEQVRDFDVLRDLKPENVAVISLLPGKGDVEGWLATGISGIQAEKFLRFNEHATSYLESTNFRMVVSRVDSEKAFLEARQAAYADDEVKAIITIGHAPTDGTSLLLSNGQVMANAVVRDCATWNRNKAELVLACKAGSEGGIARQLCFELSPKSVISRPYAITGKDIRSVLQLVGEGKADIVQIAKNNKLEFLFSFLGVLFPMDDEDDERDPNAEESKSRS